MSTSHLTEKALAESLKKLMLTYPINKIRVNMITEDAEVARHTFYNHFKDIYDLLGWIFDHEIIEDLEDYCDLEHWKEGLLMVLRYTIRNRTLCLNTFRSLGRDHLEEFLYKIFYHVLEGAIEDITKNMKVDISIKIETADFYANAFVGLFIAWLKDGLKEEPEKFADRIEKMTEGNVVALMERYKQ